MKQFLLSVNVLFAMSVNAQDCSDLFFSEYVEGAGQNKAIEVYNPTDASIDLSNYTIGRYSNGATNNTGGGVTNLTGMVASGDAFVLTNGETDIASTFGYCDPALIALGDMANHTLIRKNTVISGDNYGLDLFNPTLEWDSLPQGTWSNLGSHICDCIGTSAVNDVKEFSYVVYPNPANAGEVITITANSNIENIEIINILGERVLTTTSTKINTNHISKGTYIILINLSDGRVIENKIIIE